MGYHRAGFEVVGVDIKPQPRYPFEFHCEDAFAFLHKHHYEFDVIHASPPCQAYSRMTKDSKKHPDLYVECRQLLASTLKPWIIENVMGAPFAHGVILCGTMFGLNIWRHRCFETRDLILNPLRCDHKQFPEPWCVSGEGGGNGLRHRKGDKKSWPRYLGMSWATPKECTQAVPPSYTQYIGKRIMEAHHEMY